MFYSEIANAASLARYLGVYDGIAEPTLIKLINDAIGSNFSAIQRVRLSKDEAEKVKEHYRSLFTRPEGYFTIGEIAEKYNGGSKDARGISAKFRAAGCVHMKWYENGTRHRARGYHVDDIAKLVRVGALLPVDGGDGVGDDDEMPAQPPQDEIIQTMFNGTRWAVWESVAKWQIENYPHLCLE